MYFMCKKNITTYFIQDNGYKKKCTIFFTQKILWSILYRIFILYLFYTGKKNTFILYNFFTLLYRKNDYNNFYTGYW